MDIISMSHSITHPTPPILKERSINESIGIMLRSYTRAINKQENRNGSIFQQHTKVICLNDPKLEPAYFNTAFGTVINRTINELEYPQVCFDYIHRNPIHHHLVKNLCEWEFSSYPDYNCNRQGKLINKKRAKDFGLFS
jgi:putative transposase